MSAFSPAIRDFLAATGDARRLGPYRCKDLLDKAGTAPVFKAVEEHAGLSLRDVAVKVFDIGRAAGPAPAPAAAAPAAAAPAKDADGWQARVMDEARSLCRVQHPNVIRFHTLSTDPKRGLMGIVMEFAEGVSVAAQLADLPRGDARRVGLAVEIGINISSALAAAHAAGVVHCNVKPSNIMFTGGTHKLINFGIAAALRPSDGKAADEKRTALAVEDLPPDSIGRKASSLVTDAAHADAPIAGTVGYADPVCLETTTAPTTASDLYSLGATLYECLAGDVPALATAKQNGKTNVDAKVLVGGASPAPLAEVVPSLPAALAKLVDSLVAPSREARPPSADAVRKSLERIRSALAGHERTLPPAERGPFPGLDRYETADRDVFFGRSAETAGMIELLRTRGLVGVVGLAGTGKSSLVRAGVLPAVEEGALEGWPTKYRSVVVTPGADPMAALDAALSNVLGAPLAAHPDAVAEQLAADVDKVGQGLVLFVDQLEEIVTLHDKANDKKRGEALELLSRLSDAHVGLRVIVTVRRDLLDGVLSIDPSFSRALSRGIQLLGPLSGAAWEEVLEQSLAAYGYQLGSAELRRELGKDLRALEGAMPLAQFGLARLWAARDEKQKTLAGAKGGMRGALEQHADGTVKGLELPKETLRELLLSMTTPEGTRAHVSRADLRERFGAPGKAAVRALTKAHLLTEDNAGVTFVHDAILKEWSLVRGWLDDARDDRSLSTHLERDATRWSQSKDVAELWRKGRLSAGLDLQKRASVPLSDVARSFLAHSAQEEQKGKIVFGTLIALVVLLIVGGSLVYAKESSERATQAQRDRDALAALLAQVKTLKQQAEEAAGEAAASAGLLADLQRKMAEERASYGAQVQATIKKVASATSLDGAQKAADDLKGRAGPATNQVVPLPMDLTGGPKLDTSGPSPTAGGGAFDQGSIERVVNSRKAGVKRTCLDRSTSTASSTKVTATLTIAPNGSVQNVTTAGDEPVVGKCIEQQLRGWAFPAPGETKTVQIPFVFVRQ
jgi:eukaryotic-like serine/threonine-protein kinase